MATTISVTNATDAFADLQAAAESAQNTSQMSPYGPQQFDAITPAISPDRRTRRAEVSTSEDGTALPVVVVLSAADLADAGIDPADTDDLIYWFDDGEFYFTTRKDFL